MSFDLFLVFFFLMIRRPPRSTRTDTPFPYPTLFRSHIGSTSIPGIHAKPIIDMLAVTSDLSLLDGCESRIASLGYEALGEFGIPGRRYFRKDNSTGERTHKIHAFRTGSPKITRHLQFRDYLIAPPAVARDRSDE